MTRHNDHPPPVSIGAASTPLCYLCGSEGMALYAGLRDRTYGAPGLWNFKSCPDPDCALIWLDPMPVPEEIGKAYRNYFTHAALAPPEYGAAGRALLNIYLAVDRLVSSVTGLADMQRRAEFMYLEGVPPGRLLDVGCGDGTMLGRLRRLGWAGEGTEVDPEAAAHARMKEGIAVHLGPLETLNIPAETFDAVIMHHVVEHVHDPVALLRECRRVLRSGGRMIAVTPNAKSLGHRTLGKDWYALEHPRHLHLFSRGTLRECAARAGVRDPETWCTPAHAGAIFVESFHNQAHDKEPERLRSKISRTARSFLWKYYELLATRWDPDAGEEVVMSAAKE